jgi:hypothetical protein
MLKGTRKAATTKSIPENRERHHAFPTIPFNAGGFRYDDQSSKRPDPAEDDSALQHGSRSRRAPISRSCAEWPTTHGHSNCRRFLQGATLVW